MLLESFETEIFRPQCNPSFESLHCFAHLDQDISPVLPYLNAELMGDSYAKDPPAMTLKVHGKLITLHGRKIAINALKDAEQAEKIMSWLQREINRVWQERDHIEPRYEGRSRPQVMPLLRHLPNTGCGDCGAPTCMVFAVNLTKGVKGPEDCPHLAGQAAAEVAKYLDQCPPVAD